MLLPGRTAVGYDVSADYADYAEHKAVGRRQKAEDSPSLYTLCLLPTAFCLLPTAYCFLLPSFFNRCNLRNLRMWFFAGRSKCSREP